MNGMLVFAQACVLLLTLTGTSFAEVVRCETIERDHILTPEWVEYEINALGTAVAIRDSLGAQMGVDWVSGKIIENTTRRLTLAWSNGPMPKQEGWYTNGRITMRLSRLPNGSVQITGLPNTSFNRNASYSGRVLCSS